jgi:predicted HicB family RNase H-like nuclease
MVIEMSEEKREATSIKIKPSVWKEAKIEAIKKGITVSEFVEESLQRQLKKAEGLDKLKESSEVK